MKRHELMDLIQEIQDRNYSKYIGSNEAELATREEICNLWEAEFKKLNLTLVSNRRAQLKAFYQYIDDRCAMGMLTKNVDEVIDEFESL